jgi:hypothetical protein
MGFFIPEDLDINYDASIKVESVSDEGFANALYSRPSMTIIEGETAETPPKRSVEPWNLRAKMQISPINELTGLQTLALSAQLPAGFQARRLRRVRAAGGEAAVQSLPFTDDLYRLCLFVGSIDSSLELSPKLPFEDVAPGATWKRTVSYTPQKVKGSSQTAVQRLDAEYTYDGIKTKNGQKVRQVTGRIKLDVDAGDLLNKMSGLTAAESGVTRLPLKLDATLVFDLHEKNLTTLRAEANAKASWQLFTTISSGPLVEERLTGRTRLTLVP